MAQLTKALPTAASGYTTALSLLSLDFNQPMTFGVDEATGAAGTTYKIYGCVDTATTGSSPNLTFLIQFTSPNGGELPPNIGQALVGWPCLLIQAPAAGGAAGTFYVTGEAAESTSTLASVTAPTGVLYSPLIDLTAFGPEGTTISGSAAMTSSDTFDVYVFQDPSLVPTVTGNDGCLKAGTIAGGGVGSPPPNVYVKSWPYACVQRTGGSTVGTIKAAGVVPNTGASGSMIAPAIVITATATTITETAATSIALTAQAGDVAISATNTGLARATLDAVSTAGSARAKATAFASGTGGSAGLATIAGSATSAGGAADASMGANGATSATALATAAASAGAADVSRSATGTTGTTACGSASTSSAGTATCTTTASGPIASASTTANGTTSADASMTATVSGGSAATATCNRTASASTGTSTATANTTVTAGGVAASTYTIVGASGSLFQIATAITGGGTASAGASFTASVAGGIVLSTGTGPTQRVFINQSGQTVVGASTATVSALFEVQSTTLGMLGPRMTTAQRNAITTPAVGLQIVNTNTNQPEANVGSTATPLWGAMAAQVGTGSLSSGVLSVTGVTLGTGSVIAIDVGTPTPGAGNLTVNYLSLQADRTTGINTGAFKVTAVLAAGTINTLDTSTNVRWAIIGQ